MREYYVFATQQQAQACIDYINSTPWFPITGERNGQPAPDAQATERWAESPLEMISGEWAVPRIPESTLDHLSVPAQTRAAFRLTFGQDIRQLDNTEFVSQEIE
jgi:hypothetical protein